MTQRTILRASSFIFILLACWGVQVFPLMPHYYLRYIFIYFTTMFLVWAWFAGLWSIKEAVGRYAWLLPYLAGLLVIQAAAAWVSALELGTEPVGATLAGTGKVAVQLAFMAILLQACRIFAGNRATYAPLLWGAGVMFIVIVCTCAIQGIYIGLNELTYSWARQLTEQVGAVLKKTYPWLEARWPSVGAYDFYHNGAYALTVFRVNGIYEEASALAANVGVFFIPLSFGLCFLMGKARSIGRFFLLFSLLLLVGSISLTGLALFISCLVVGGVLFFFQKRHRLFFILSSLLLLLATATLLQSPKMIYILNQYTNHPTPRIIITLDSLELIKQHPWLGVGRSNFSAFIVKQERYGRFGEDNLELKTWKGQGSVPELSALPAFAAEYGLPVMVFCCIILIKLWKKLYRLRRTGWDTPLYTFILIGYSTWLALALVAGFASINLRNPMFCLPFFFTAAVADLAAPDKE